MAYQKNTKNPIGLLPSLPIQRFWSYKGGEFLKGISILVQSRKLNQISSPPIFNLGMYYGKNFRKVFFLDSTKLKITSEITLCTFKYQVPSYLPWLRLFFDLDDTFADPVDDCFRNRSIANNVVRNCKGGQILCIKYKLITYNVGPDLYTVGF